jgi:ribosome production factor 2
MGVSRAPGATAGTLARVPKTRRSKRAVEKRAPKLIENPKAAMMIRGTNTSAVINELLCDLYVMKKPFAKHFSRKNDIRPFEDATSIEFFGNKNDASLFAFGSHNKKRPHNLVLGRLFDYQMLDMCELGITGSRGLSAFPGARKPHLGARPCMIFEGADFELVDDLSKLRSLLLDFFRGWPAEKVNLRGIDHAIVCTAVSNTVVCLRTYEIRLLKVSTMPPLPVPVCVHMPPALPCPMTNHILLLLNTRVDIFHHQDR